MSMTLHEHLDYLVFGTDCQLEIPASIPQTFCRHPHLNKMVNIFKNIFFVKLLPDFFFGNLEAVVMKWSKKSWFNSCHVKYF